MSWTSGDLGDLLVFQRGHDLPDYARQPGNIPVVGSAGVNGYHNEAKAPAPCVTIGRSGASIGKPFYLDADFWPHNACLYVKDFKGNNPKFLFYLLGRLSLDQFNSGAAQPSLNRNFLYGAEVTYPLREEQDRIVAVLSAYDDLIENNRRRIALLEEAAWQFYKEWFVRLRFPGHEHVKVIEGVPEGWERLTLREVATLHYGKALKEEVRTPGDVPVYGSSGIVGFHNKALVVGPAIVLGRKGNVGSVRWSPSDFFPIDTVYFIASEQCNFHLYLTLQHMHFMSTDVAVPGLNRDFAYSRLLVLPSAKLAERFEDEVTPIFLQMQKLTLWNNRLIKARDLLLPKLMSGVIAA